MSATKRLRESLSKRELVVAPGIYNGITARLVESAGFDAAYITGYGTSAAMLGLPDMGLLTMNEMLNNIRAIADVVEIPLIVDGDTGYGNPLNVMRTVKSYEKAGASAIHIEDQEWPKRCGHMNGKQVIPKNDMVAKVKAAVDSRRSRDFTVIARTDALALDGWDAAIERGNAYAEAGADVIFIDAHQTLEQVEQIPKQFNVPCMINMVPLSPCPSIETLQKLGYGIAVFPGACLVPSVKAIAEALKVFRETGTPPCNDRAEFLEMWKVSNDLLGVPFYNDLEQKYKS